MSEIRATTISDETGNGPIALTKQSAAKVWISLNQTGTQAILNSFNVASITDQGTGLTTVNYSSSMSSATYSAIAGSNPYNFSGSIGGVNSADNGPSGGTKTSARHNIDLRTYQNSYNNNDDASSAVFGDLA